MEPLIELRGVYFKYPDGTEALRGINLSVMNGEVLAILGPNGSGKTTLLLIMAGLLKPQRGLVLFRGRSIDEQLPEARKSIGIVFQNPDDQLFNPTVRDELAFALKQLNLSDDEIDERIHEVSQILGIEHLLDRPPYRLSVGEKKLVALASVLVYEPDVLLLDEPVASLAPVRAEKMLSLITRLRRSGKTIVVATHDVEFVARIADRVILLRDGCIVKSGTTREVLTDLESLRVCEIVPPVAVRVSLALKLTLDVPLTEAELIESLRRLCNRPRN